MKKLLLDADVIIDLHRLHLFEKIRKAYEIKVTRKVFNEVKYYREGNKKVSIDISQKVTIIEDVDVEYLQVVQKESRNAKLTIDSGEATLIAYILQGKENILLCLFDKAAIKLISYMGLDRKSISLEKAFKSAGHHPRLYPKYSESSFRKSITEGKVLKVYDTKL